MWHCQYIPQSWPYVPLLALWCFDLRWLHTTKIDKVVMIWGPSLHTYGIEDYICYAHNYYILSISSSQGMWQRAGIMILSQSRGTDFVPVHLCNYYFVTIIIIQALQYNLCMANYMHVHFEVTNSVLASVATCAALCVLSTTWALASQ